MTPELAAAPATPANQIAMEMMMKPIEVLRRLLALPIPETNDDIGCTDNGFPMFFDPWELFPSVYGGYSGEFDHMAITVLTNIQAKSFDGETLAHEMFREMLCTADLCDYGTSPRSCFPNWGSGFEAMLPDLIDKWKAYFEVKWGQPYCA